uniref:CX domain-containing protein n=1 Tax=Plectus sambesii TaxID=2011161 RepID=A0A914W629_9BILA
MSTWRDREAAVVAAGEEVAAEEAAAVGEAAAPVGAVVEVPASGVEVAFRLSPKELELARGGRGTINSPGAAVTWNSRRYYWGSSYYQYRSGYEMCSMPLINSTDDTFNDVAFDNGTRPEMIAWSCHALSEYCCGYECCPSENEPISIWAIIGIVVGTIILLPVLLWCAFYIWYLVQNYNSRKKEEGKGKKAKEYSEQDRIRINVTGNENEGREKMAEEEKALMQSQITEIQPDQALENVEQTDPLQPQYPLWVPPPPYNSKL